MSCTVAILRSPMFSPSRCSLSCKAASTSSESVSIPSPAPPAPTAGSPLRPFRLLRAQIREEASPLPQSSSSAAAPLVVGSVLKRRRPAPLMVPTDGAAAAAAAVAAVAAVESDPRNEVEEEGEGFAAYCRRGKGRRRVEMEDRHVAKVALGAERSRGAHEKRSGMDAAAGAWAELAAVPVSSSAFRAMKKPNFTVRAYMAHIAWFAGCSPTCYVVAYLYLDRLLRSGRHRALVVDSCDVHRLLITAMLAAVKFMDDM